MTVVVISSVVFLALVGFGAFMVLRQIKKTDPKNADTSIQGTAETAQEFLPFKDIKDSTIDLGGHDYRVIIECSSTNYNLKTDQEKEIIEVSFKRFLNSLTFPITFFIQTKELDNSKILSQLSNELVEAIEKYPQLEEYANAYYNGMATLSESIGNNKQKKKYIIVPYNEGLNIKGLSDSEVYEYSIKEVRQRAGITIDNLSSMGIKANILNTKGLIELVYSTYHKDSFIDAEVIDDKEFLSLMVSGEKNIEDEITDDKRIEIILAEAQNRIKTQVLKKEIPEFLRGDYQSVVDKLDVLRKNLGGNYKSNEEDISWEIRLKNQ